jgi:hypothetical protein
LEEGETMSETVLCSVPVRAGKLFSVPKSFALVLTDRRTILVPITSDMLKQAITEARDRAAADGKGFMGKWAAQMKASLSYTSRYLGMDPEEILRQSPHHQVIANDSITKVRVRTREDDDGDVSRRILTVTGPAGKAKYELVAWTKEIADAFRQAYGNRFKG